MGTFALQPALKSNKFIGLGALYGGAIYSENPLATITSNFDIYQENTAIDGAAINKNSIGNNRRIFDMMLIFFLIVTQTPIGAANTLTLINGTFESNVATGKGGAIYLSWQSLAITDSSFTGNSAQNGGALYFISHSKLLI